MSNQLRLYRCERCGAIRAHAENEYILKCNALNVDRALFAGAACLGTLLPLFAPETER